MESIGNIIEQFAGMGFPAAISIYLLVRMEQKLSELTVAIWELRTELRNVKNV